MVCLYEEEKGLVGRLKEREGLKDGARPRRKQEAEWRAGETLN